MSEGFSTVDTYLTSLEDEVHTLRLDVAQLPTRFHPHSLPPPQPL